MQRSEKIGPANAADFMPALNLDKESNDVPAGVGDARDEVILLADPEAQSRLIKAMLFKKET